MIAAIYTQNQGYRIADVPVPDIQDDELLLRVMASSICGTDLRTLRNGHRKLRDGQTIVLGHEFAGVIERCGSRVRGYAPGMRVGVAPNIGCGRCALCARGLPNMCPEYSAYGIDFDGGHAEFVRIPAASIAQGSVVPLPDSVPFLEGALLEPLSCVVNGARAARIELGDTVVVFGAGPIGLMHLMVARQSGAGRVLMADPIPARLESARAAGADGVVHVGKEDVAARIMAETGGQGADVIITACPVPAVQQQALGLLAPYGRVCLFGGLPKDNAVVPLDTNLIHYKNLLVTGVTGGAPRDFRLALQLVTARRVDITRVVSHVFSFQDMARAFEAALSGNSLKIALAQESPAARPARGEDVRSAERAARV